MKLKKRSILRFLNSYFIAFWSVLITLLLQDVLKVDMHVKGHETSVKLIAMVLILGIIIRYIDR